MLRLTRAQVSNSLTSKLPRHFVEVIAFGGIVVAALVMVDRGDAQTALPTLGLYAFAGYRLMPAFQQLFASAVSMRFTSAAVASLAADLNSVRGSIVKSDGNVGGQPESLPFEREVRLDDVSFVYPGSNRAAIRGVCLIIRPNESIGIVGRTGSGKTTLADILLGLYMPTAGTISIDGTPLSESNVRAWRQRVGYVPQNVFLANATISQNIAFGLADNLIDHRLVERAAKTAQADEFIQRLPQSYNTSVGERGVKLSGGQRQRLGIARALYHSPDILVFDEATSALDGMTEDAVMDAIGSIGTERTVILIAHRLRTVESCQRIVMLENGEIVADGNYRDLITSSLAFKRLAGRLQGLDGMDGGISEEERISTASA